MSYPETISLFEELIPAIIGGTIGLLAIFGMGELIKETSIAFKKRVRA